MNLTFGVKGNLWNARFAEEFRRRKGYDLLPGAAGAVRWTPARARPRCGLITPTCWCPSARKITSGRSSSGITRRGMMYGCDHGGRGRDVLEFGDYFRTQRWMTGPGNDQPRLGSDIDQEQGGQLHRPSLPAAAHLAGRLSTAAAGEHPPPTSPTPRSGISSWATTC